MHLVRDILDEIEGSNGVILDPFCGTGTTALVCAERGIRADTIDINPFLIWLAQTKCANYPINSLELFVDAASTIVAETTGYASSDEWIPAIHEIEKWWDAETLRVLGHAMAGIRAVNETVAANLLKIVFCRVMIETANVSFGHQSMSFKAPIIQFRHDKKADFIATLATRGERRYEAARSPIETNVSVSLVDARHLDEKLKHSRYDCVITSPLIRIG